jgi:hypothetical protein
MAIVVKPADQTANKWATNAGNAGAAYTSGINNPRVSQTQATIAAAQTWAQGVQTAVTNGTFAKGVQRSDGKWQARASTVGAQRFPQGVTAAKATYQTAIAAVLQVIANITLSQARMPRGDPANYQRSQQVGQVLHAAKVAGTI